MNRLTLSLMIFVLCVSLSSCIEALHIAKMGMNGYSKMKMISDMRNKKDSYNQINTELANKQAAEEAAAQKKIQERLELHQKVLQAYQNPLTPPTAEHKVYSGVFKIKEGLAGDASYTYLASPTGERIFDGPFKFIQPNNSEMKLLSYSGNFKNNRQVGDWEIVITEWGDTTRICTFSFDDRGLLSGPLFYSNASGDKRSQIETLILFTESVSIDGSVIYTQADKKNPQNRLLVTGQYSNNKPSGIWELSNYPYPIEQKIDKQGGYYWETTIVDESTGDKTIEQKTDLNEFYNIDKIIQSSKDCIYLLRDSKVEFFSSEPILLTNEFDSNNWKLFNDYSNANADEWLNSIKLGNGEYGETNNTQNLAKFILDKINLPSDTEDKVVSVYFDLFTDNEDNICLIEHPGDNAIHLPITSSIGEVLDSINWQPYPKRNGKYVGKIFRLNFVVDPIFIKRIIKNRRKTSKLPNRGAEPLSRQ